MIRSILHIKKIFIFISILTLLPLHGLSLTEKGEKDSVSYFPVFEVHKLYGINSSGLDFSPVIVGNQLIFVTEREIDFLNYGESRFDADSYLSIHASARDDTTLQDSTTYKTPKLFSNKISQLNHSGPISFNAAGDFCVFTRVKLYKVNGVRVYRPQLYSAKKEKEKWGNIQLLEFNRPDYSYGHPALSKNGKSLYFASDMEGGYGANDLYITHLTDSGWSTPQNLGDDINTFGNEVFPFQYKDSLLFFSSNGHPGLGGLDIFFTTTNDHIPGEPIHLDNTINTAADEFGIFLDPTKQNGYLSSNRTEGMGNDDIYGLTIDWVDIREKLRTLAGYFEYRSLPGVKHNGLQVYLLNEAGDIIYSTITDENGYFAFTQLPFDLHYKIKTEPVDANDILLFLLGEKGKAVAELTSDNDHIFNYKKLSFNDVDNLQLIYSVDSLGLVDGRYKKSLSGQMTYRNLPYRDGEGLRIFLLNKDGEIVYTTITDENGSFTFQNLPYENNYTIMTEELLPGVKLLITNEGNVVAIMKSDEDGKYVYIKLPYMSTQDLAQLDLSNIDFTMFEGFSGNTTLAGSMTYRNLPYRKGSGMKIYLLNDEGEILFTTTADKEGRFVFNNLPYGHSYMIKMEETNEEIQIQITNNGNVVSILTSNESGLFNFTMLPHLNSDELALMGYNQEELAMYRGTNAKGASQNLTSTPVVTEDNKFGFVYDLLDHKQTSLSKIDNDFNPALCPETTDLSIEEIDDCIDITIEELLAASEKANPKKNQVKEIIEPKPKGIPSKPAEATISQDAFEMIPVYFDFDEFALTYQTKDRLSDVIAMMKREKSLYLKIYGYSDSKGSSAHNLILSKNRSKKIFEYLVTNGLSKSRMKIKWYGENNQAVSCGENCSDEEDRLNRRVEIVPSLF